MMIRSRRTRRTLFLGHRGPAGGSPTALADALLADGLPDYRDDARTVRYRLAPGLW